MMRGTRRFRVLLQVLAAPLAVLAVPACAQAEQNSFAMRNSQPVMVENALLPPGLHIWKQLDSPDGPIIQITDAKTHRVEATVAALNAYREQPADKLLVRFWETPAGAPAAVHMWFNPGEQYGNEFTYPAELAALQSVVPSSETLEEKKSTKAPVQPLHNTAVRAHPSQPPAVRTSARAEEPGSWAIITGPTIPPQTSKTSPSFAEALRKLPLTATIASLIGLIGLAALAIYALTHLKRRNQRELQLHS